MLSEDDINLAIALVIISNRNPSWDIKNFRYIPQPSPFKAFDGNHGCNKVFKPEAHQKAGLLTLKTPSAANDITYLIPLKDNMTRRSPFLAKLNPEFQFVKNQSLSLLTLRDNLDVVKSLTDGLDDMTIQWIGKRYKRYRWLIGYKNGEQQKLLVDTFQLALLSHYTAHCSLRRFQRYLQETLFDKFITKELSDRDFYTSSLKDQFGLESRNYSIQNVCIYHSKLLVRLVLLREDSATTVRFVCHVLYIIEVLIKERLKHSEGPESKSCWQESFFGTPDQESIAFLMQFKKRWEYLQKFGKTLKMPILKYFKTMFRFCLRVLSPLIQQYRNTDYLQTNSIISSKRHVQCGLLMLEDKRYIAEFQMINWKKLHQNENTGSVDDLPSESPD